MQSRTSWPSLLIVAALSTTMPSVTVAASETPIAAAEPASWLDAEQWAEDLAVLNANVRDRHPDSFARTPESVWAAQIEEAAAILPSMDRTGATAEMIRLVSLLDTHSGIFPDEVGFDFYCQQEWTVMADGVYVTAAEDPAHLGARILAIGDEPMDLALARVRPYMNSDNESSMIWQLSWMSQVAQLLQAAGVVSEITKPDVVLRQRDGSIVTVQLRPMPYGECAAIDLVRTVPDVEIPMAASRRGEPVWWEVDPDHGAFVLAYNQPGTSTIAALEDLESALDAGEVDRVVVDLRYAPGGSYSPAVALVDALSAEPRIDQPGRLAVVVGRESFSATNALISAFERRTRATFVGEPTPGRPNPFMNEITFALPSSGLVVHIPTGRAFLDDPDDHRDAIYPDVSVPLVSSDYFSGRDRALDVAMTLP